MNKILPLALAAALLAANSAAAPAVNWDGTAAAAQLSPVEDSLRADFRAFSQKLSAQGSARSIYGTPQRPQDAFASAPACASVDAVYLRAFSLPEAVRHLQPCAQDLARAYGLPVSIEKGVVAVDGGHGEAWGILVRLPAAIQSGNRVLMDLSYSIRERRKARILGFPAAVVSGSLESPSVVSPESFAGIPAWIDRGSLRVDDKLTRFGLAGELRVVLVDQDDDQVEFVRPAVRAPEALVSFTRSTDEELGPFKVTAVEALRPGELGRLVAGVKVPGQLDPSLRRSVEEFFSALDSARPASR